MIETIAVQPDLPKVGMAVLVPELAVLLSGIVALTTEVGLSETLLLALEAPLLLVVAQNDLVQVLQLLLAQVLQLLIVVQNQLVKLPQLLLVVQNQLAKLPHLVKLPQLLVVAQNRLAKQLLPHKCQSGLLLDPRNPQSEQLSRNQLAGPHAPSQSVQLPY